MNILAEDTQKDIAGAIEKIGELGTLLVKAREDIDGLRKDMGDKPMSEAVEGITADLAGQFVKLSDAKAKEAKNDEMFLKLERGREAVNDAGLKTSEHRDAFRDWISSSCGKTRDFKDSTKAFMNAPGYKTLAESVITAGGLFVDPDVEAMILKNVVDIDPVRTVAKVTPLTIGDRKKGYRCTGNPTMYWETETGSGTESEPVYQPYEIPAHPGIVKIPVSGDLLDDVRFMEAEIASQAGEAIGYGEGAKFISGDGVGCPMGIVTNVGTDAALYPAVVASTGAGATNVIAAEDFAEMWGALKSPYRGRSTWMFNSNSLQSILQLQATTGNFLWQPGLAAGPPDVIFGRPFIICETIADEGSDTYPLYLGDFGVGYEIVDRLGLVLQRDPYGSWPKVIFKFRKRVGGQVVKAEAIKILKTT